MRSFVRVAAVALLVAFAMPASAQDVLEEVQKLTDEYGEKVEALLKVKEAEVLEV